MVLNLVSTIPAVGLTSALTISDDDSNPVLLLCTTPAVGAKPPTTRLPSVCSVLADKRYKSVSPAHTSLATVLVGNGELAASGNSTWLLTPFSCMTILDPTAAWPDV